MSDMNKLGEILKFDGEKKCLRENRFGLPMLGMIM